jgi:hypothetical protein
MEKGSRKGWEAVTYTNEMRFALRGLKNPAPIGFDVSHKDGQIYFIINKEELAKLSKNQLADFRAYIRQAKSVVYLGGGGDVEVVVQ